MVCPERGGQWTDTCHVRFTEKGSWALGCIGHSHNIHLKIPGWQYTSFAFAQRVMTALLSDVADYWTLYFTFWQNPWHMLPLAEKFEARVSVFQSKMLKTSAQMAWQRQTQETSRDIKRPGRPFRRVRKQGTHGVFLCHVRRLSDSAPVLCGLRPWPWQLTWKRSEKFTGQLPLLRFFRADLASFAAEIC